MKNKLLVLSVGAILLFTPLITNAQSGKIKNVELNISGSSIDVEDAKYNIDLAFNHESTKNSPGMWGWRGVVYSIIASSSEKSVRDLCPNNDAAMISAEAFTKFYEFTEPEQKKFSALDYANSYVVSTIIECFNEGIISSSDTTLAGFEKTKKLMNYVEVLLPRDKEEKLLGKISKEKSYLTTWQSANQNKLYAEELVYLTKLMNEPKYMNSFVFVRASEIYLMDKNYEKALEVLEKGRVKIPSKGGDFLNQQINIEIERKNIAVLISKFTEGINNEPDNKEYYFSRGVAYHQIKNEERDVQDKEYKNTNVLSKPTKFYGPALADYRKAIELDPGYFDAIFNEAVLISDSADYIYKLRNKVPSNEYTRYDRMSISLYNQAVKKFLAIYEMNMLKGQELVDLLKTIKTIYAKLNDEDNRIKYNDLYKEEIKKLNN